MEKKPEWLKVVQSAEAVDGLNRMFGELKLNTVCNEAHCPNRAECYKKRTATFLIMGANCTRRCKFCNVSKNEVCALDENEPAHVAEAVLQMQLKHVVITSVTRDDLPDGGASHFAKVTRAIREAAADVVVELLIPDLRGDCDALGVVLDSGPDILGHNLETVPRLYDTVRPEADYRRSLKVLSDCKRISPSTITKTGIMVGLGETYDEVTELMDDAARVGCEILTIGQYLRPSKEHLPIFEYVHPDIFDAYRKAGEGKGIKYVYSAPLVRSSYNAAEALEKLREKSE